MLNCPNDMACHDMQPATEHMQLDKVKNKINWIPFSEAPYGWRSLATIGKFDRVFCIFLFQFVCHFGFLLFRHATKFDGFKKSEPIQLSSVYNIRPVSLASNLPSFDMPRPRHFCKRQYWHRFRLSRSIMQALLREHTYWTFVE
jgi:hypothetical protein